MVAIPRTFDRGALPYGDTYSEYDAHTDAYRKRYADLYLQYLARRTVTITDTYSNTRTYARAVNPNDNTNPAPRDNDHSPARTRPFRHQHEHTHHARVNTTHDHPHWHVNHPAVRNHHSIIPDPKPV